MSKLDILVITGENCPACEKVKSTLDDLMFNKYFKEAVHGIFYVPIEAYPEVKDLPTIRWYRQEPKTKEILLELVGAWSKASLYWKTLALYEKIQRGQNDSESDKKRT